MHPEIIYIYIYQKGCEALTFLLDNIYIRFDSKLYRQIVDIPMGTYCTPLVADLFGTNVNLSNDLFSDVYRSVNYMGSLAKFT